LESRGISNTGVWLRTDDRDVAVGGSGAGEAPSRVENRLVEAEKVKEGGLDD